MDTKPMPEVKQHINLQDRTKKFSLSAINLVKSLGPGIAEREIGKQLIRSGMSVGANTRAAYRARSTKEFVSKRSVVVEEADETGFWLELVEEAGLDINNKKQLNELHKEADELTSIFVSIIKKNKQKYAV